MERTLLSNIIYYHLVSVNNHGTTLMYFLRNEFDVFDVITCAFFQKKTDTDERDKYNNIKMYCWIVELHQPIFSVFIKSDLRTYQSIS